MTKINLGTYSLFPAIIFWGVILGGIVYSNLIFMPVYLSNLPDSASVVNGTYGLHEAPFWMTMHPLLLLSLVTALALNWKIKTRRKLLLISFGIYLAVLGITTVYFVPELQAFGQSHLSNIPPAEWLTRGNRWRYLSWIRGVVMFAAILPLLNSLTKSPEIIEEQKASEV